MHGQVQGLKFVLRQEVY